MSLTEAQAEIIARFMAVQPLPYGYTLWDVAIALRTALAEKENDVEKIKKLEADLDDRDRDCRRKDAEIERLRAGRVEDARRSFHAGFLRGRDEKSGKPKEGQDFDVFLRNLIGDTP